MGSGNGFRMMPTAKQKRQLKRLFHFQKELCHWCQRKMVPPGQPHIKGVTMNPLLCTYDHLDDRFSEERGKHFGEYRNVAACWECNARRGRESQARVPIEELHRRSKRHRARSSIGSEHRNSTPRFEGSNPSALANVP